ncbi:hypothetical protein ACS0PU_001061 [Formica fusca]
MICKSQIVCAISKIQSPRQCNATRRLPSGNRTLSCSTIGDTIQRYMSKHEQRYAMAFVTRDPWDESEFFAIKPLMQRKSDTEE